MNKKFFKFSSVLCCILFLAGIANAQSYIYDDFNNNSLSKWDGAPLPAGYMTPANGQLNISLSMNDYDWFPIKSTQTFSFDSISNSNPFEFSVDIIDGNFNSTANTGFIMKIYDSNDVIVAHAGWWTKETASGIAGKVALDADGTDQFIYTSNDYNFISDSLGMRVTDTGIHILRNGSVLDNLFLAFDSGYVLPADDMKIAIALYGIQNGGEITIDNVNVTPVPEPATIGIFGLCLAGIIRKRK